MDMNYTPKKGSTKSIKYYNNDWMTKLFLPTTKRTKYGYNSENFHFLIMKTHTHSHDEFKRILIHP